MNISVGISLCISHLEIKNLSNWTDSWAHWRASMLMRIQTYSLVFLKTRRENDQYACLFPISIYIYIYIYIFFRSPHCFRFVKIMFEIFNIWRNNFFCRRQNSYLSLIHYSSFLKQFYVYYIVIIPLPKCMDDFIQQLCQFKNDHLNKDNGISSRIVWIIARNTFSYSNFYICNKNKFKDTEINDKDYFQECLLFLWIQSQDD